MPNPISWVDAGRDLTYEQAQALAGQLGGRLLVFTYDPSVFTTLADTIHREEEPVWIDASSTRPNPTTASHLLVEFLDPATVRGLGANDVFLGGPGPGRTLRAGAGDDVYVGGGGGGKIYLEAGDDRLHLGPTIDGPPWTSNAESLGGDIYDGSGEDRITADGAVIHAAIDGDNDIFHAAARVSYADAVANLLIVDHVATGGGIGTDILGQDDPEYETTGVVIEVVGGQGDDTISGFRRIQGGQGDDVLTPIAYAEGGQGDDTLIAQSSERVELRAEGGDDTLIFYTAAKATGGVGADRFVFGAWAPVTLNDWSPGEILDLSALSALTSGELFAGGYLKAVRQGGYTNLLYDADGGADSLTSFITFKGVFSQTQIAASLVAAPEPLSIDRAYFSTPVPGAGGDLTDNVVLNLSLTAAGPLLKTLTVDWTGDGEPPETTTFVSGGSFGFGQGLDTGEVQTVEFSLSRPGASTTSSMIIFSRSSQAIERLSTASNGAQSNGDSTGGRMASQGRYVAFSTAVGDLDTDNTVGRPQVFRKDLVTGEVERVSSDSQGVMGNEASSGPALSGDGRYVVFNSYAVNLTADPYADFAHVFVKDMTTGAIANLSLGLNGVATNQDSQNPDISDDGRYVVFDSYASNLTSTDTHYIANIFRVDLTTHDRILVSGGLAGQVADAGSFSPSISDDGRFIAFYSLASNLVEDDTNAAYDVFVSDTTTGTTTRVSTNGLNEQATGDSSTVSLSGDGRYVVFSSTASNLVAADTNGQSDVFVKDLLTGAVSLVSSGLNSAPANGSSDFGQISPNGRYVTFESGASNLVPSDDNGLYDTFRKDLQTGEIVVVSINRAGQPAGGAGAADVTNEGVVTYSSTLTDAVANDTNNVRDILQVAPSRIWPTDGTSQGDALLGGAFGDILSGAGGDDLLRGAAGVDVLWGGEGDDELEGGAGNDQLIGGLGSDRFVLAHVGEGVDEIVDFVASDERIIIFTANFPGNLSPGGWLVDQAAPHNATDNLFAASEDPFSLTLNANAAILFNTASGALWFDPDGEGEALAIQLAQMSNAPALSPSNFLLV